MDASFSSSQRLPRVGVMDSMAARVLPPTIVGDWGDGKWKQDGRQMRKTKKKKKPIPLKRVLEAIIQNRVDAECQSEIEQLTYQEIIQMKGVE